MDLIIISVHESTKNRTSHDLLQHGVETKQLKFKLNCLFVYTCDLDED